MSDNAIIAIAAALAIALSTMFPALAQGKAAKAALMEALTIYGLLIALMLMAKF